MYLNCDGNYIRFVKNDNHVIGNKENRGICRCGTIPVDTHMEYYLIISCSGCNCGDIDQMKGIVIDLLNVKSRK